MKNVSKETIIRTIVLAVAFLNSLLIAFDKNPIPFSDNEIYEVVSTIVTAAATIWAWWKNNSFTTAAIKADEYMKELKKKKKEVSKEDN